MTKKIFRSIFFVSFAVLFACLIIILGVMYGYFVSQQKAKLASLTTLAAQGVENEGMAYFKDLSADGVRLTWVAADGVVLYDNQADAAAMENHGARPEIRQALSVGIGESERMSATLAEKTIYRAQRLSDGTVIRVAIVQYTIWTLVVGVIQPFVVVLAIALILSGILARRLALRIVKPLNALDLEDPLENDAYEELSPLLTRIERQRRQIKNQMSELRWKQDEFAAITGSMNEGLILLNGDNRIVGMNPAAARLFGAPEDSVGRDMLTVDRSLAMQELIGEARQGLHAERLMPLAGGMYQVNASPVLSEGKAAGVAILAFDITEKASAEQRRREFSANVSHELKTPLHSIMGTAELIENGLVKSEDLPRFGKRIRAEAGRLVMLIDDIIRLSQLDEGAELPREEVGLKSITQEAAQALEEAAANRNIGISVRGENVKVIGARRLLYEIAYNLIDNAVKYNTDCGRVEVTVAREGGGAILTVADTGIGIPREHQPRVFERFYRVDKSHSKETGGTGLGLSIVKHAAQYHNAAIDLASAPGKGTRISVHFPEGAT